MKVAYFVIQLGEQGLSHGPVLALEEGAVIDKAALVRSRFTVVSFKDRLAAHNRDAKKVGGTPRFSDPEKYLLWLHQSGEVIHYVKAERASAGESEARFSPPEAAPTIAN